MKEDKHVQRARDSDIRAPHGPSIPVLQVEYTLQAILLHTRDLREHQQYEVHHTRRGSLCPLRCKRFSRRKRHLRCQWRRTRDLQIW